MRKGKVTAGLKARRVLSGMLAVVCSAAAASDLQPAKAVQATTPVGTNQARSVVRAIFDRLDCDMDGTVEKDEVDDHFAQVWAPVDRDRSRYLSPLEYSRLHFELPEGQSRALFDDADANADGKVSAGELRLHLQRLIQQLDDDYDNEISRADAGLRPEAAASPKRKPRNMPY